MQPFLKKEFRKKNSGEYVTFLTQFRPRYSVMAVGITLMLPNPMILAEAFLC
jgi:hypothetical protein